MTLSKLSKTLSFLSLAGLFILIATLPALANVKQVKVYKEAFPDEKPKCACCPVDEKPKKEDGQHDLNAYGKKALAVKEALDADSYKQAGSNNCAKE